MCRHYFIRDFVYSEIPDFYMFASNYPARCFFVNAALFSKADHIPAMLAENSA